MFTRKPLSIAMAAAFGVASAGSMMSTAVHAQEASANDDQMIEEIVTTGSRIKRSTNTESQEIITFTAEDMNIAGDMSVAEALRSSTMNSIGSFREASGYSAQSNATLDLRGVGSSRTLILINGRRTTGSPSLSGGGTVNLNMIPFSAVDRIEVIADGASAVYGSDAIVGVVNVILKKDFDGLNLSVRYGDRSRDDGQEVRMSMLTGAKSDRGSVTMGFEYDRRDPIFDADRDYTAAKWSDLDGDGYITGYDETVGVSGFGYTMLNPIYEPEFLGEDAAGVPIPNPDFRPFSLTDRTTWYVDPGADCPAVPSGSGENNGYAGPMLADAFTGPESGFYCGYAYGLVAANRAGLERMNTWVSAEYDVTDSINVYADVMIGQNESFGRYAPPAASGPTIPGDPRNDIGATYGYFRWTDIGTRDNVVNDNLTDINFGVKGDISDSVSWDVNYTFSKYTSASIGNYYLSYAGLAYNAYYGVTDFDEFVANIKSSTVNNDKQSLEKITGGMQFDMFEMTGGNATAYAGAEYYKVNYQADVDAQSEAGLIGGSAGNSNTGYRDVGAVFVEAILPVLDSLEIDLAARYDDYSDFGTATTYRVGGTFVVPGLEALKLKASYGTGFRAPDLSSLYGATYFTAEPAYDYLGCEAAGTPLDKCRATQKSTYISSDPNLDAESSTTWSIGADYTFLESWVASINYFNLDIDDSIDYVGAQRQLDLDYRSGGGNPNVVRNDRGGVAAIYGGYANGQTTVNRSAVDMGIQGSYDTSAGIFGLGLNSTYYVNYDQEIYYNSGEIEDITGTLGFPEWRTNLLLTWNMDAWNVGLNYDYIGESKSNTNSNTYDGWGLFNATVGYSIGDYGTVTLGANNLLDEDPLLDDLGAPVDEFQYDQTGRVVFIRYSIDF